MIKHAGHTDIWLLHHLFWHPEIEDVEDIKRELRERGYRLVELGNVMKTGR